ncbi:mitochondrial inner membrane i-AAA protease supercomplex subunit Mgr3p [[Candida] railenensis]|uniref:Mitochondrial inner membrane i-AAA protease supercomplex subunit Mgr3p n=1 Tax=[Candida] railenensis TaxID=45579 RepID=A0A9P0VVJ8_9ASCO|nr:mitochondrial inner membrane i-AAA protease supercomplex subunit Mgr3p [[Candida] railenensis]
MLRYYRGTSSLPVVRRNAGLNRYGGGHQMAKFYSTNYNYQYNPQGAYQNYQPRKWSWSRRLLYSFVGISILSAYGYYVWWPKHTFPSSVAKILRKGLWAESDKGENDYQLALKYYLEALKHCDEIGMDSLCDEYTGIQLKVGEMFERLDRPEDAAFIYNEVATLYMKVLTSSPTSEDGKRIENRDHRAHLIQKDLRLAIKLVEMNMSNPHLCKAILITHLLIAQDEVQKKLGSTGGLSKFVTVAAVPADKAAGSVSQEQTPPPSTDVPIGTQGSANSPTFVASLNRDNIEFSSEAGEVTTVMKNPMAWEPFSDEFFTAMDLLTAICITTGDLSMATKVKVSMTEWMILADVEAHKIVQSQCNLGSLLYLQAEEFEAKEIAITRGRIVQDKANTKAELARELQTSTSSKEKCIALSIKSYESVLEFVKNLPQDYVASNNSVNETVAIATYGLGVVNLHLSEYTKAERLLREARVRSKACGYNDLIVDIERELEKLFKEKKSLESNDGLTKSKESEEIEMMIHMKK